MQIDSHLDVAELSDLHARAGHGNGTAFLEALEEPLLHRVVIQRPINVHRSDGGPRGSLALQERLSVQFSFVSALGIHCVDLSRDTCKGFWFHESRYDCKQPYTELNYDDVKKRNSIDYLKVWELIRFQVNSR